MSRPLHIAIDARWIFPHLSGIGHYTQELIRALAHRPGPHRFTLIFRDPALLERTAKETGFTQNPAFTGRLVPTGPYSPMDQWVLPSRLKQWDVDVYHATNPMMPFRGMGRIRRVVTFHDLIPLLFRDHAPRAKKNRLFPVFKWIINTTAAKADAIIAVSESTRRDVLAHLRIPADRRDRVRVIHEGVGGEFHPAAKPARADVEFLFVGRRDPYKGLVLLVRALAEVRRLNLPARLRVIGSDDPRYPEARQEAAALGVDPHITWSGYVPEAELPQAYRAADVFVLPSRYEGFGLPVLEAMASGTPVICSNTSSLPEVAGEAALLIDPLRVESLAGAMREVVVSPELRTEMARKGLAQAARFSWDDTAAATLAVYEDAGGRT